MPRREVAASDSISALFHPAFKSHRSRSCALFELHLVSADVTVAWPVLVLLGWAVGVLIGFFGVGGGWLVTPALNVLGFPIVSAVGTSLAYVATSAVLGSLRHYRLGNVGVRLGGILGLGGLIGTEFARRAVLSLEQSGAAEVYVRTAYVLLLWGVGLPIVLGYLRGRAGRADDGADGGTTREPNTRLSRKIQALRLPPLVRLRRAQMTLSIWVLAIGGIAVGAVAGLGAGGGFIMVPLLVYVLGIPTRVATGSTLLFIAATAGYGVISYGIAGKVEVLSAGLLFLGATAGVQLGAQATLHASTGVTRLLLGCTLLLAGVAVVLLELQQHMAAVVVLAGTALAVNGTILSVLLRGRRGKGYPPV